MKIYLKFIAISVLVLGTSACSEEKLLDLTPINNISIEEAFSTPSLIESSINGVYNAAAIGQYNTTNPNGGRGFVWGAAFVQQGDNRGEDVVNIQTFYAITYTSTYDAGSANNTYYWVDAYRLINRCNLAIEGVTTAVSNGIITQAVADNYIGQAKFLRAITHFELLTYFARPYNFSAGASHLGIPYREVGVNTQEEIESELLKPRNTVAECYDKIIADLNAAESLTTNVTLTKASKNAAIAFKTRVYLHKRDWNNVIAEGQKLNGAYTLTDTPNGPFANSYVNTESIFSILMAATLNPGVNAALASQYKTRKLVSVSPIIWRDPSWLSDDKRREEGVLIETVAGVKYTNKYKDGVNYTDAAPVIRYAEVLLNMAEAYARRSSADASLSVAQLNKVRNRALANPTTQQYELSQFLSSQTALVEAIIKERRIEFLMEGRRWSDIHRLQGDNLVPIDGIPAKVGTGSLEAAGFVLDGTPYSGPKAEAAIPGSDFRFLWPIPLLETNNNPTLKAQQNPGWE